MWQDSQSHNLPPCQLCERNLSQAFVLWRTVMTILTVEMSSEKQLRELESSTKALCIHLGSLSLIRSLSLPSHYFHPHLSLHISYPCVSQLLAGRHCLPVSGSGRIATAFLPPQALCPITPHSAAPSPSPALVHNFPLLPIRVEILSEVHTLIMSHPFSSSVSDEPHKQPQAFS